MSRPLRVLNVEDSERDVALLTRYLTGAGYDVFKERVETAEAMKAALMAKEWDIILCDYSMPGFNALAALNTLHDTGLDIPLIIISGTVGEEIAVEAMLTGANDYLPKNNLARLIPAIERELQEAKNRRRQRDAENERRIIFEILQGIIPTPNVDEFLKLVHRSIAQIVYGENCFVMLHDPSTDMVSFEFWVDRRDPRPAPKPRGNGFASYVLRTGKPMILTPEMRKAIAERGEAVQIGSVAPSWLGVPLRTPSRTIGVMVLQHYEDEHAYTERDLEFLSSVGDQIALAIERKRAEEALGESEERYRLLFEKNPEPMWVYDLETLAFLEVNDAAIHRYGYTRAEFLSMTIRDIRPPEDMAAFMRSVEDQTTDYQDGQVWKHRRKDGSLIDVEITSHVLNFGGVPGRLVLAKDVTESMRAKEALIESEERYRDLVENAIDIIYTHDLEGRFTSINRAAETITGFTRDEILTMNLADSVAPEYVEKARQMIAAKLTGKEMTAYDLELIARDGRRVPVEVNTRIIYEDGVAVGVQGIARDVTERKQLEGQLLQSQKMEAIGLLAGGIAHDFNNLLTAITGYSDLTLRKLQADDPLCDNIREIKNAGERAAALTSQLLAFSRKQVLKPRVHNLNTIITDLERMLRRIIRESVEFDIDLDPQLGNIKADPGQIEQVIMNLAVNARDAMPNGGRLAIQTRNVHLSEVEAAQHVLVSPGAFIKMTVTDTGHGIDPDTKRRIFEPFFTTKEVGKGSGLGLSTVHGIVMQSGGDITVRSEVGHGAAFEIYLPCVDENVQQPRWKEDGGEDYSGTETILLVEDDETVRNLIREILKDHGYEVIEAADGTTALSIFGIHKAKINLLVTDIIMPGISGGELRDRMKEIRPDIKVLFISGYTDDSLSQSGILSSDAALLEKPFTPDDLARKVREVLGEP
jgi:PAS domain S-box-containing protein